MKIISFNIRCANDPNGNSVKERSKRLKIILDKYKADIIGFQETTPEWYEFLLKDYNKEYEIFNRFRDKVNPESSPVLWKKERFDCLDKGYFWLSDTPHIQSDGWDEWNYKRICIWARLFDKKNKKIFNFLNTHYGFGDSCQLKSSELIIKTVKNMAGDFTILTGDFNLTPETAAYKRLTEYFTDVNAATKGDWRTTFHNYGKVKSGEHIDYCFISGNGAEPFNSEILTDTVDGKYASDHYGILSEIKLYTKRKTAEEGF